MPIPEVHLSDVELEAPTLRQAQDRLYAVFFLSSNARTNRKSS